MDLDIKALDDAGKNYATARRIYTQGANSQDEDGKGKATLQSFSTLYNKAGPPRFEPAAIAGKAFWGDWDFADNHMLAAINGVDSAKYGKYGSGASAKTDDARTQMIKKLAAYTFIPLQVGHELQLTLTDFALGSAEAPEHWDEAWAFYAGSTESGSGDGVSAYVLAEKRAPNFGTEVGGRSSVNRRMLAAFNEGKASVRSKSKGAALLKSVKCVRALLLVPSIQGCLRYAYKAAETAKADDLAKEQAEAWAFCAAVLPALADVNGPAAQRVRSETYLSGAQRPSWPVVRAAFGADNLNKMGLRCADIGSLNNESPEAKHPVCSDGNVNNAFAGTNFY